MDETIKEDIRNYTLPGLEREFERAGIPRYRAGQVFHCLHAERKSAFDEMQTLPKGLRERLASGFTLRSFESIGTRQSSDGSIKFLMGLADGNSIEAVFMPHADIETGERDRVTLCVSTMAGCPAGCVFCATGALGFRRSLETYEIVGQLEAAEKVTGAKISNIVLMGMGEPLLNYGNVAKALNIFTDPKSRIVSRRRITLSTVGVPPKIKQLAGEERPVKLAISLHATTDETRKMLIPYSGVSSLKKLLEAVDFYYRTTKMPVTFEYIIFEGVNDSAEDIARLARIARRIPSRVNIIPFNDIGFMLPGGKAAGLRPASPGQREWFAEGLKKLGVTAIIRESYGSDIEAACGQLALSRERAQNGLFSKE